MKGVTEPRPVQHILGSTIRDEPPDRAAGRPPRTVERLDRLNPRDQGIQRKDRHASDYPLRRVGLGDRAARAATTKQNSQGSTELAGRLRRPGIPKKNKIRGVHFQPAQRGAF